MKSKKIVSIIIMFGFLISMVNAQTNGSQEFYFEDFSKSAVGTTPSGWKDIRNSSTVTVLEENGNQFMRIQRDAGAIGNNSEGKRTLPIVPFIFDTPLDISNSDEFVLFETKLRTNVRNSRKAFRVNYDYNNSNYNDCKSNNNALWYMHNNDSYNVNYLHSYYTNPLQGAYVANTANKWTENEWITLKTIIYPKLKKVTYYENGNRVSINGRNVFDFTTPEFNTFNAINNICFTFRNDSTTMEREFLDIDYVKVDYFKSPKAICEIDGMHDVQVTTQIKLKFNTEMRESTLNNENIQMINNKDGSVVKYTSVYNKSDNIYTITPLQPLINNTNYKIKMSSNIAADIYADASTNSKAYYNGKNEFEFRTVPEDGPEMIRNIFVDGMPLAGFSYNVNNYKVRVDNGTTLVPKVSADVSENITLNITDATKIPGTTIVKVSKDGFIREYQIDFLPISEVGIYAFYDDFELDAENTIPSMWLGDVRNAASVNIMTDEITGNKFMRIKQNTGSGAVSNVAVVPSKNFKPIVLTDREKPVVIETKLRTNSQYYRKYLRMNYNYNDAKYQDMGSNDNTLMFMHNVNSNFLFADGDTSLKFMQYKNETIQNNQWYTVKIILYPSLGKTTYYINGQRAADEWRTNVFNFTSPELASIAEFKNLCFTFRNVTAQKGEENLDIDFVKVYDYNNPIAYCDLNEKNNVASITKSIDIKFNTEMAESTLSRIKLFENGNEITYTAQYDQNNCNIKLTPSSPLKAGSSYTVKLGDVRSNIYAVPQNDKYATLKGDKEFSFYVPKYKTDVIFKDENLKEINKIQPGNIKMELNLFNSTDVKANIVLLCGLYKNENGTWKMVSTALNPTVELEAGEGKIVCAASSFDVQNDGAYKIRAFVWNENQSPYANVQELK